MTLSIAQKMNLGFGLAFASLCIIAGVSFWSTVKQSDEAGRVSLTDKARAELEDSFSHVTTLESAARGYVITGDEAYLGAYAAAAQEVQQSLNAARALTADDPRQQANLDAVEPLIAQKISYVDGTIALRRAEGFDAAQRRVLTGEGPAVMDQIRAQSVVPYAFGICSDCASPAGRDAAA